MSSATTLTNSGRATLPRSQHSASLREDDAPAEPTQRQPPGGRRSRGANTAPASGRATLPRSNTAPASGRATLPRSQHNASLREGDAPAEPTQRQPPGGRRSRGANTARGRRSRGATQRQPPGGRRSRGANTAPASGRATLPRSNTTPASGRATLPRRKHSPAPATTFSDDRRLGRNLALPSRPPVAPFVDVIGIHATFDGVVLCQRIEVLDTSLNARKLLKPGSVIGQFDESFAKILEFSF